MIFKMEDLQVGYKGRPVVDKVNIELNRGEVLCILGQNGCGKSTILKTIIRQIDRIGGRISLVDRELLDLSPKELARSLSVVLTDRINPDMVTGEEIVATGRYPYTGKLGKLSPRDYEKIDQAIELVNGKDLRKKEFIEMSDGEKQRMMIARAICQEPEIIVLDEPTSFLDIKYKIELLDLLNSLALKEGKTIIMSLHEIDLVNKVADKVLLIKDGNIYRQGLPEEVLTDENIHRAYEISKGHFNSKIGYVELPRNKSSKKVFVMGGEGRATAIYRFLNKKGLSFYSGIIHENDLDYEIASQLAEETIGQESFLDIDEARLEEAKDLIDKSQLFIELGANYRGINKRNEELLDYARSTNKKIISYGSSLEGDGISKIDRLTEIMDYI